MEGIGLLSYYALYNLPYEKGSDKEVGLTPWFGRVFFTDGDDTCDNIFRRALSNLPNNQPEHRDGAFCKH